MDRNAIVRAKNEIMRELKEDMNKEKKICTRCKTEIKSGNLCERCEKLRKEQIEFERMKAEKFAEMQISNLGRDIGFKQDQIDTGEIIETRVIKFANTGEPTIIDGYLSNVKPKYLLENEIDELKLKQQMFKEQIESIKKAEEEDAKTADSRTEGGKGE